MNRRSFLLGLVAAPAVIRTPSLLMPVKKFIPPNQIQFSNTGAFGGISAGTGVSGFVFWRGDGTWVQIPILV